VGGSSPTCCFLPSLRALTNLESLSLYRVPTGGELIVTCDRRGVRGDKGSFQEGGTARWCLQVPPSLTSLVVLTQSKPVRFPGVLPPLLRGLTAGRVVQFSPRGLGGRGEGARPPPCGG